MWGWDAACWVGKKIDKTIREDAPRKIKEHARLPTPDVAWKHATKVSMGIARFATREALRTIPGGKHLSHICAEIVRNPEQQPQREKDKVNHSQGEISKTKQEVEKLKLKQEKMEAWTKMMELSNERLMNAVSKL